MLTIKVPINPEGWDEQKQEFVPPKEVALQLEHSLISLSKWESKWNKAFLGKQEKTNEEIMDYIRCMTLNKSIDPSVYEHLTRKNVDEINKYINAPMTATHIYDREEGRSTNNDTVTSELIYYWMIALNIPFECQKWHLNRLLTLIKVCNVKNRPPKKGANRMPASTRAAMNAARRKRLGTRG